MNNLSEDEFEEHFTALNEVVQAADTALSQGKIVNLGHIEAQMNDLCEAAQKAPPEIAAQLRAPMAGLISSLDALALKLEEFKTQKLQEREQEIAEKE